jgi:hypothetical protein
MLAPPIVGSGLVSGRILSNAELDIFGAAFMTYVHHDTSDVQLLTLQDRFMSMLVAIWADVM